MIVLKFLRIIFYVFSSFFPFFFFKKIVHLANLKKVNALLLTHFKREIEIDQILEDTNNGIIYLDHNFQKKIHGIFFGNSSLKYYEYVKIIRKKKLLVFFYSIYLKNLLNYLKKKYKLKFVINFAVHYKSEFLYDLISSNLKIHFLTFHRECMYANENVIEKISSQLKGIDSFKGSKIIVHNKIVKKVFTNMKFCDENNIELIGPLRIDENIKKINTVIKSENKKTILFYIFGTGAMILDGKNYGSDWSNDIGWFNLLDNTYKSIIKLSKKFDQCEFVFKAKYDSKQYRDYHNAQIKRHQLSNINYLTEDKNYSLLEKADLVISFNSTTIMEAILFDKNILIPFFDEALDNKYSKYLGFKELINTNLVCKNPTLFMEKISNFIQQNANFKLEEPLKSKILNKYLGEIDGKNKQRTINLLMKY